MTRIFSQVGILRAPPPLFFFFWFSLTNPEKEKQIDTLPIRGYPSAYLATHIWLAGGYVANMDATLDC